MSDEPAAPRAAPPPESVAVTRPEASASEASEPEPEAQTESRATSATGNDGSDRAATSARPQDGDGSEGAGGDVGAAVGTRGSAEAVAGRKAAPPATATRACEEPPREARTAVVEAAAPSDAASPPPTERPAPIVQPTSTASTAPPVPAAQPPASAAAQHVSPAPPAPAPTAAAPTAAAPTAAATSTHGANGHRAAPTGARALLITAVGAVGVVYGDIGTSPLYAIKECFSGAHGVAPTPDNVLGVLSLVFWALTLVVVVKYLGFVLRADNDGEGGILALLALVQGKGAERGKVGNVLPFVMLGLVGSSLLFGEGTITPAISVLSAVEGLEVTLPKTDGFDPHLLVVPTTLVIIVGLFFVQQFGTHRIGALFGPATCVWFLTIAATGTPWLLRNPEVLAALDPRHGVRFFAEHGAQGYFVLGSVVLCITGGEALYADMGHFGKRAIRFAWFVLVYPALLLNYFGQGAYLMTHGDSAETPFYGLVEGWLRYPLIGIATIATIVASQALISGAFSLANQAVQLGYSPRVTIVHTSGHAEGQIYVPEINWLLMVTCVALVLGFRSSSNLAAAYGIAVTGTMTITSILFFVVFRRRWGTARTLPLLLVFLVVDLGFFGANVVKFFDGGWVPLALGAVVFSVMTTWKRGRQALFDYIRKQTLDMDEFLAELAHRKPHRVAGTAVFMTSNPRGAPPVLVHHVRHNKVLHENVVLLSVQTEHAPVVPGDRRVEVSELGEGLHLVIAHYGFMQSPNVKEILLRAKKRGVVCDFDETTFYLGRETLLTEGDSKMMRWRKILFAFLSRNARPATMFFKIPPDRVVEIGMQIQL
jgi:KUP system potassium uptake protein